MAGRTEARAGNTRRVLATLGVLGAIGALATVGTYSQFTDSVSTSQTISTGTVKIALGATNRLTVAATNVAPGDTIQRAVDLSNTGTIDYSGVTVATTATTSSLLDTDATLGLQMSIDKCSVAWTETALATGGYTYACSGTLTNVLASRPVITAATAMSPLSSLTAGSTDRLRVTLTLPTGATNAFQGITSTIAYTFTATQRAGTNR